MVSGGNGCTRCRRVFSFSGVICPSPWARQQGIRGQRLVPDVVPDSLVVTLCGQHLHQPGIDQPAQHLGHGQLAHAGQVQHLGRREGMQLERGIARLDRPEQVLVPRQRQVGIVAPLQQQLAAVTRRLGSAATVQAAARACRDADGRVT